MGLFTESPKSIQEGTTIMRLRAPLVLIASLSALGTAAAPALATDTPSPTAALQDAPSVAALQGVLGKCADTTRPTSGFGPKGALAARRTRVLHGRAADKGCGVAMVTVSIAQVHGKRCRLVSSKGRLGRLSGCSATHFLMATGTGQWRLRLPRGLPHGTYVIHTRAIDYAGNVQPSHTLRLKLG
jgi:hypothetical protein